MNIKVGKTADEMLVKRVQWMTDEQRMEQFKLQRVTVNDEPVGPDRVLAHQEVLRMHIPAPEDVVRVLQFLKHPCNHRDSSKTETPPQK